jgi:hypothetical protein
MSDELSTTGSRKTEGSSGIAEVSRTGSRKSVFPSPQTAEQNGDSGAPVMCLQADFFTIR